MIARAGMRLTAVLLAVIATGCSFSFSAGGNSIDQSTVEQNISDDLTEKVGVTPGAIDCDGISDIAVEEGNTFVCVGTAPSGGSFDVDVTLTDDDGGVDYFVAGVLNPGEVEQEISNGLTEQVGVAPEGIDCEAIAYVTLDEGDTFMCVGTAQNGENFDVNVTMTDANGSFSYAVPE